MDYSKADRGGTRVHDPLVARTLMTGIGQSVKGNRVTGSARAMDVLQKTPDPNRISDPALNELHQQGAHEVAGPMGMTGAVAPHFPLRGNSKDASARTTLETDRDPNLGNHSSGQGDSSSPSGRDFAPRKMLRTKGAVQSGV
jgi:hypothetical protein